jgi:peptidyl-prolyl cis-trans isomerase-like protein 2
MRFRAVGTDKLYITHSEWSSGAAYGAHHGSGTFKGEGKTTYQPPLFDMCAASLRPFTKPVCTPEGMIFDADVIDTWLKTHDINPVNGALLCPDDLISLKFSRHGDSESGVVFTDPITLKNFTDSTCIVAVRHGDYANVFAWETIEQMNIKIHFWHDLVDDVKFKRTDIIILQDPHNNLRPKLAHLELDKKNNAPQVKATRSFVGSHTCKSGTSLPPNLEDETRISLTKNASTHGRSAGGGNTNPVLTKPVSQPPTSNPNVESHISRATSACTTGVAAASFTSTGLSPTTRAERRVLNDEEALLKPRLIDIKGYARIKTNFGDLVVELNPEYAPKAVWYVHHLGLSPSPLIRYSPDFIP